MKTSSDFLWRLIRSMTSAEKTYFKRNFIGADTGSQKRYLQLFNAIAAQKKYDEAALLRKFSPELTRKKLAYTKHYLQNQVCESIVHYDCRNSVNQKIFKQIQLIRLYRQKGMAEEANAIWKKAVFTGRKNEAFGLLGLLKNELEKIILFSNLHTSYDDMHRIVRNQLISYNEYSQMMVLRDMYTETLLLKRNAHFDMDEKLQARISELLATVQEIEKKQYGNSFWFRHYFRMNKGTLLYLQNETGEALELFRACWLDWKKNGKFINSEGEFYIELLYMINYAGVIQHEYDYVENVFNDPVNKMISGASQRANYEVVKFLALNKVYNKTARYRDVEAMINSVKPRLKHWEPVLNDDLNVTVHSSVAIGCFVLEQYEEALYFIKKAIGYTRPGTREDLSATNHILHLLIAYSLNNSKVFDSVYRSTYGYFYKRMKKHPYETILVHCLSRTFYMKDLRSKLTEYNKTLEKLSQSSYDNIQQKAFNIFNFEGWLKSKVQRISYRQFVENKVKTEAMPLTA